MRVLVTGGAGFIGSHVVERLLADPAVAAVRVLDDLSTGRAAQVAAGAELVVGCVTDAALVARLTADVTAVVHLAAIGSVPRSVDDPVRTHEVNVSGTLHVLEGARASGAHVVFASSSAVYGTSDAPVAIETAAPRPMSPYAASKLAAESYVLAHGRSYGQPVLPFRFFNVYGPRQSADHDYAAVVPRFTEAALTGRPLCVHGDGLQTRDFTHVDTVARALVNAVTRRLGVDEPVNLAFGTRTSVLGVADALRRTLGTPVRTRHEAARVGDVRHSRADTRRLAALLPDLVDRPFADGLATTVAWYESHLAAATERPLALPAVAQ